MLFYDILFMLINMCFILFNVPYYYSMFSLIHFMLILKYTLQK